MPFKRTRNGKELPYYYVKLWNLPGYGSTGYVSTRVTSKRIAQAMERLLQEIAQHALLDATWYELLDAVCKDRTLSLPDLLAAKNQGRLDDLRRGLRDPLLSEAIDVYQQAVKKGRGVRLGFDMLRAYAPKGARLSLLRDARTITQLCRRAEEPDPVTGQGRKRNSVRRTLLRAISLLLRYHLGGAERDRIFADIQFAGEDDTREVHLTPKEISRLIQACHEKGYDELAVVIQMALLTSADRGVLLAGKHSVHAFRGLLVRDLRIYQDNETGAYTGEVYLEDGKTEKRSRTVPLPDVLCRELFIRCRHKAPDDPVFDMAYSQLDFLWKQVRKAASLGHLRFKDLRAQTAIYGEEAGIPLTILQRTMGHGQESMTQRYQKRTAVMSQAQAEAIAQAMFGSAENNRRAS